MHVCTDPQILDNSCDDHPSPTTAASTVNQAVATLEIEDVWAIMKIWPPSWSSSWWTILSSSSQLKEVYHVGGVHLWEVVGQVQDVLHQVAARSENTHFLRVEDQWYWIKKSSHEVGIWKSGMARLYTIRPHSCLGRRECFLDLSLKADDLQAFVRISNHTHL